MYAKYTVVLKSLMETEQTKELLEKALSTYPLYVRKSKEEYIPSLVPNRSELNKKLLNAYKYREIGFETVGRFIDELEIAMNEIMPYYNQMFMTADLDFNVIYNVDYERTITRDATQNSRDEMTGNVKSTDNRQDTENLQGVTDSQSNTDSTGRDSNVTTADITSNGKNVHSETPQGNLNIPAKNIDSVNYADNVKWNEDTSSNSGTSEGETESNTKSTGKTTSTGTTEKSSSGENNVESENVNIGTRDENELTSIRTKGNYGVVSAQDLIAKYREIIVNIEQRIINDERIQELFMMVF